MDASDFDSFDALARWSCTEFVGVAEGEEDGGG